MTTYWSELKIKEGDDGILNFIFTPTEKEFDPLSFLLPTADLKFMRLPSYQTALPRNADSI